MRCVVCGHRHHHCDRCHKVHDRLHNGEPLWSLSSTSSGKIVAAKGSRYDPRIGKKA